MSIKRVDPEEAERASAVLCVRDLGQEWPWDDNEKGFCSVCQHPIVFRPHSPKTPPKICIECMLESIAEEIKQ